ncbi:uncharacterized protein LOC129609798 [Condylostylus longicornis]|uniref:uncharacterized protein LOC129609798 n=1 Tax=Condylostylus longicornis TaxID=2530218 RepID=UPI00244E25B2|nr:uncharacterized protein LOC129609798 [Condylostylus longicornis]
MASERVADVSFHASSGYEYPPVPEYGPPPAPVYGPPAPKPIYGPPPHPSHIYINHPPPFFHHHHHPREETWLDKLKLKIDLFTIGKLLLKLIIFKKIVKFFAMICLLLFLPKLKNLFSEDMMEDASSAESRDFGTDKEKLNETINEVTKFAKTAMETFSRKYEGCERDQIWCRFQRTVDVIDKKYPYEKIVQLYSPKREVKA